MNSPHINPHIDPNISRSINQRIATLALAAVMTLSVLAALSGLADSSVAEAQLQASGLSSAGVGRRG